MYAGENRRAETRGRLFKSATCIDTINIQRELSVTRLLRIGGGNKCHLDSKELFVRRRRRPWGQRSGRPTYQLGFWFRHFTRGLTHRRHLPLSCLLCLRLSFFIWGARLLLRQGADGAGFNFPDRTVLNGGAPLLNNEKKKTNKEAFDPLSVAKSFSNLSAVILLFSFCRFNTDCWWKSMYFSWIKSFSTRMVKMISNSWGLVGTLLMLRSAWTKYLWYWQGRWS